ncbi:MAG: sugar phosphate nucleotidyltransferase [Thermodesulfovibrionales bacterium]
MINAFILAAGLGERLRPLTNHIPKPLLPILGKPVLGIILEKLSSLKPDHIGINLHYRGEEIERFLCGMRRDAFMVRQAHHRQAHHAIEKITFFKEASLLGTGGALKNAESLLKRGTFLVHNSDILSEINLNRALEFHKTSGAIATLIIHDHPDHNRLLIDETGLLTGLDTTPTLYPSSLSRRAFTGIAIYEPEFLAFIPEGYSSVTEAWTKAIKAGQRILTMDVTGTYWTDIGRPASYAKAVFDALRREGENIFNKGSDCSQIIINGLVSIEGKCHISKGVSLRNCIVIDRKALAPGNYENSIIGPDFEIRLNEKELFGSENGLMLIGSGGSDRRYYRVTGKQMGLEIEGSKTAIFVKYPPEDPDFERHIEYTRFFLRHKIPVPELIQVDISERTAIFEDLGDTSLYNWLKCRRRADQIENMYRKVIDIAASIHSDLLMNISECPLLRERVFDHNYFRWETDYFIERFVKPFYGKEIGASVYSELGRLAFRADSFPKTVIHRDLQSQNIMIKDNRPRVIDYQGARIGPPAYDIASLLWDPYYRMGDAMRERLLNYYIARMSEDPAFDPEVLLNSLLSCRLQRHMQALGAYGFLSHVKGKGYFLKFVPRALKMLKEEISLTKEEYPSLYELILSLSSSNNEMFSL